MMRPKRQPVDVDRACDAWPRNERSYDQEIAVARPDPHRCELWTGVFHKRWRPMSKDHDEGARQPAIITTSSSTSIRSARHRPRASPTGQHGFAGRQGLVVQAAASAPIDGPFSGRPFASTDSYPPASAPAALVVDFGHAWIDGVAEEARQRKRMESLETTSFSPLMNSFSSPPRETTSAMPCRTVRCGAMRCI
ncbi:uncharacterized protein PSFLO_01634 [Pseudozyma flocculosa]|uniref:Uncharacterized protein n=1 Tax=Pseudozyma flocculosa TaxID=84751 RepID=A0A5C3EV71_9BASI|nr:uncharacterized protein PSFLO_01634 [Pseudozyma flocculosa]